ncbi:MAG: hypothetical protein ACM3VV_04600, partial [Deltaproteobacteria bacterium]
MVNPSLNVISRKPKRMKSLYQSKNTFTGIAIVSAVFLLAVMMSGPILQNVYADHDHGHKKCHGHGHKKCHGHGHKKCHGHG